MIEWTASLQPLLLGSLLLWAGSVKLRGMDEQHVKRVALSRIVGERFTSPLWRAVGAVEIAVGAALLAPPAGSGAPAAALALSVGFLGYLGYARRAAPDSGCGCLSARLERVSWRTFARAGVLLLMAAVALANPVSWWVSPLGEAPVAAVALLLGETAVFLALSSEFDRYWLLPLRQLKVRLTHPLATSVDRVPLEHTVAQVQSSEAYRQLGSLIASDVQDSWEDGEWRLVCYGVRQQDGTRATAVFAAPLSRFEPESVRLAIVDENRGHPVPAPA